MRHSQLAVSVVLPNCILKFQEEDGLAKLMQQLGVPEERKQEMQLIERKLRKYITFNIDEKTQNSIDGDKRKKKTK